MAIYLGRFTPDKQFRPAANAVDFSPASLAALQEWWRVNNCKVMGAGEAGFRALGLDGLANRQAAERAANGCYEDPPSGFLGEGGKPPFRGGQCAGTRYQVDITVRINGGAPQARGNSTFGPISGPAIEAISTGTNRQAVILRGFGNGGNPVEIQMISGTDNQTLSDLVVTNVEVTNGGPDNCGDQDYDPDVQYPPGKELPPPPAIGDEVAPSEPFDVPIDIDGVETPITIPVGPGVFGGDKGTRVPVNGQPFDILPDGGVYLPDNGEEDLAPGESLADKLEELSEDLNKEISGNLALTLCDGEELNASYSGVGLLGIEAMMRTAFELRNSSFLDLCGEGASIELSDPELLATQDSFEVGQVDAHPLSSDVLVCLIKVTGNPPGLRVFKLAGNQSEARYGFWSVMATGGNDVYSEKPCEIFVRDSSLPCPNPLNQDRFVRISLKPGLGYSLFVMKEVS